MAVNMSQSNELILGDKTVSRMMAERAAQHPDFKDLLSNFVHSIGNGRSRPKKFSTIVSIISKYRDQIANQMDLRAPHNFARAEQNLNTYLKQSPFPRVLVSKHATQEEKWLEATSEQMEYKWVWVGAPACIARLAFSFLQSTLRFQADPTPFPFERLPPELRLQVYHEVLRGNTAHGVPRRGKSTITDPELITVSCNRKNTFLFPFGVNEKGVSKDIDVSLLVASKSVNREALPILYQSRTFDFATNVKLVMPFLSSLSAGARHHLKGIVMELHTKNEPDYCCGGINKCYGKGVDNQGAWVKACRYIGQSVKVKELTVTVNVKIPADFKSLKWVKALVSIKSLNRLTLQVDQHYRNFCNAADRPMHPRVSYKHGLVSSTNACNSQHLVPLFDYLLEEMVEG